MVETESVAIPNVFLALFIGATVVSDVRNGTIPNWLILLALTGGTAISVLTGRTPLWSSLLGACVGMAALMIPFALGALGAGDVKFLGAIGAILGVHSIPRVLFYTAISGGILSLIVLAYRWAAIGAEICKGAWTDLRLLILSRGAIPPAFLNPSAPEQKRTLPYGLAIASGTLAALYLDPEGHWAGF